MKMKPVYTFTFCLVISFSVFAQKNKVKFHSINAYGVAIGQSDTKGLFQSVNGLAYDQWFSGIGFGANYYHYKSYPLFIDARRYFGENGKTFAYADIGYNFSGKNEPAKEIFFNSSKFSGGVYTDVGLGYQMKFIKNSSFLINAGFSYKEITNKIGVAVPCLVAPCPVDYSYYNYGFGTLVLKAGIDF